MWIIELIVVLFFIWLGARLGSIGIGFAGGFGVLVLALVFGLKPGGIPIDVILIIMSVISAIAAMQVAGGLDYMVQVAEGILRRNPKYITFLAPVVTYTMTIFAGTGLTAFSTLPVIAEVAKGQGIRPSRPLAIATVASQVAITASPISAAVIFLASELEKVGVSYLQLLMVCIPTSFTACMLGAVVTNFLGKDLKDDPVYQERLAQGLVSEVSEAEEQELKPGAKASVGIFLLGLIFVVGYASAISDNVGLRHLTYQSLGQTLLVDRIVLEVLAQKVGHHRPQHAGRKRGGDADHQELKIAHPHLFKLAGQENHRRRNRRGRNGHLGGHRGDGQRPRGSDPLPLGHLGDHRQGRKGGQAGAGENGHGVGHHRGQEGDVLGVAPQDALGHLDHVVQPAGHLHGRNRGNDRHDDQNHVDGDAAGLEAEDQRQHQHAKTPGKPDADAAQARTKPYEKQDNDQFDNPHGCTPFRRPRRALDYVNRFKPLPAKRYQGIR